MQGLPAGQKILICEGAYSRHALSVWTANEFRPRLCGDISVTLTERIHSRKVKRASGEAV